MPIKTSLETAGTIPPACTSDPIRQIIKTVEHKIRNLEKRKSKLESYQDLRISGKSLTADQEVAVSKYEEVVQCLLCAQEFLKQIQGIYSVYEKEQKNILRKENSARVANEVFKVRETLVLQDIVQRLRNCDVRRDFEAGSNGAVKLETEDLALVDKLLAEGFVSLDEADTEDAYSINAHRAADHWVSTVDGKPKQFSAGIAYDQVRRVVRAMQDCGYFQQRFQGSSTKQQDVEQERSSSIDTPSSMDTMSVLSAADSSSTANHHQQQQQLAGTVSLAAAAVDSVALTPNDQNPIPVLHATEGETNAVGVQAPVVVPAAPLPTDSFAHQQQQPLITPQPQLPIDPHAVLPDELRSGAFSFLQDCELDEQQQQQPALYPPDNVGLSGHPPNSHPAQQQPPTIPNQPPANLVLINPMILAPGQSHPMEQLANGGGGGGVTPPMFSFPFQQSPGPQHMNPAQQLMKAINAVNNFNHHPLPPVTAAAAAPAPPMMVHNLNGNPQHRVVVPMAAVAPGYGQAPPTENGNGKSDTRTGNGQAGAGVVSVPAESGVANNADPPMTISEWDPKENGHQPKRETSTESSSAGDRRRDDRRSMGGGVGGRQNGGNEGYNGSRRRYADRSNTNGGGGGGGGANYNGSRMQRNGSGGPGGAEQENGTSYRQGVGGGGGKPHHFNRMSNGGGGGGGEGGRGSTFYRNNDPSFYNPNNGVKSSRHSQGHQAGFSQQRQSAAAATARN